MKFSTYLNRHVFVMVFRVVAVIGRDIEFEEIDINPCPTSLGNELPNMFANTARCRSTTVVS